MKFVFNESLLSSIGSEITSDPITKFVSSGLILEKRIVIAIIVDMDDLFRKLDAIGSDQAQDSFLISGEVEDFLKKGSNREEFHKRYRRYLNSKNNKTPGKENSSLTDTIRNQVQQGADTVEDPASKLAPFLETKDQIIQRFKPFMSENEIGEIFNKVEKLLPFDEIIGILEFCINKSRSCNAKSLDVINFFIDHYNQKRQYSLVKNLITQACDYQKINPTIDIFTVLRDAVAGNQPNVNLGYLSKDPENQLIFNNLIMLSQSSLPEQDEEIRRRFQESRDALDVQQTKFNMQKAIFDMMKIEESNRQLEKMIAGMGELFKTLITNPMYRALRDIYYDLRAGKILVEAGASLFVADTSAVNKRSKPSEDMYNRQVEQFPRFPDAKTQFSDSNHKFLKLASPEVSRYIYSQNQQNVISGIVSKLNEVVEAVKRQAIKIYEKIKLISDFSSKAKSFYDALINMINKIIQATINGTITFDFVEKEFQVLMDFLLPQRSAYKTNSFNKYAVFSDNSKNNVRIASAENFWTNTIGGIGLVILSVASAPEVAGAYNSGKWLKAANMIAPLILGLKNGFLEFVAQTKPNQGKNAPQSSYYFENGKLTEIGKQRLANNQETMIALGIADQDAMALSKFSIQKEELLKQVRVKEENLKSAEQQIVQLGGSKTDYTVGDLPLDFQKKLKDFLDFCSKIEVQFRAAINIFRNASKNINNLLPDQQIQATGLLAQFESDLLEIQKKKSEWSSMKNIAAHLMRKKILLQKLKPLQTQLDTMKKLGIPMSNVIASPNGILSQVGKIRNEEQQALETLRKEYYEKIELLKNPDAILPMVKYPTDTGVTKLPQSPDQSPSEESPFDVEKGSQFETQEANNVP
jgi:hypothetical protein